MPRPDFIRYKPCFWLQCDLMQKHRMHPGQVLERVKLLRTWWQQEGFSLCSICTNRLDNPFAADHALRTIASQARQDPRTNLTEIPNDMRAAMEAAKILAETELSQVAA